MLHRITRGLHDHCGKTQSSHTQCAVYGLWWVTGYHGCFKGTHTQTPSSPGLWSCHVSLLTLETASPAFANCNNNVIAGHAAGSPSTSGVQAASAVRVEGRNGRTEGLTAASEGQQGTVQRGHSLQPATPSASSKCLKSRKERRATLCCFRSPVSEVFRTVSSEPTPWMEGSVLKELIRMA